MEPSDSSCSVLLIVAGADLDPDRVSVLLGVAPYQFWRKGEPKGLAGDSLHEGSGWKARVPDTLRDEPLDAQVDYWISELRARAGAVRALRDEGHAVELNCFAATSEGFVLPHATMGELAHWGVDLDVTFSCPDGGRPSLARVVRK